MWFENKYRMILLKKTEAGGYDQVRQLKLSKEKKSKTYKKVDYEYSLKDVSYTRGRTHFIYKDIDTKGTVAFHEWADKSDIEEPGAKTFKTLIHMALTSLGGEYGLIVLIAVGVGLFALGCLVMTIAYPYAFPGMMKVAK